MYHDSLACSIFIEPSCRLSSPTKREEMELRASSTHVGLGRHGFAVRPLRGTLPLPSFGPSPPHPCRTGGPAICQFCGLGSRNQIHRCPPNAAGMQVCTRNFLSEKEAISCQARICEAGPKDGSGSGLRSGLTAKPCRPSPEWVLEDKRFLSARSPNKQLFSVRE